MNVLHILKTAPDGEERRIIDAVTGDDDSTEVRLYDGVVDYDDLVHKIFASDKVFRLPDAADDGRSYRVFVRVIPHDPATGKSLWRQEADKWDNAIMLRKSITVASGACI